MTARYVGPNTDPGYRASTRECLDRAQRALEVAEVNLDKVSELLNDPANSRSIMFADVIGHAEARTRLGMAWVSLSSAVMVSEVQP